MGSGRLSVYVFFVIFVSFFTQIYLSNIAQSKDELSKCPVLHHKIKSQVATRDA